MKCALELVTIASVRAEEITREAEIRKQKEQEAKRVRTLEMCELLGAKLECQANEGIIPRVSFHCDDKYQELASTRDASSYYAKNDAIDLELLKEWFAQFCFEVTISDFSYCEYSYGLCNGYTVNIQPNPECLK